MSAVEKFVTRVQASTKAQSKEIRLSIAEAQELSFEISRMLIKENQLLEKITNLQEGSTSKSEPEETTVAMDGGTF